MTASAPGRIVAEESLMTKARTIKELRDSGWQRKSVKQELRDNLIARLRQRRRQRRSRVAAHDANAQAAHGDPQQEHHEHQN